MVVVVFRARLKPTADQTALVQLGQRMYALASSMPGYLSYKEFAAEDGETVAIVEFESLETLAAWRKHPEHEVVQQRGRDEFFLEYHIQVCTPVRDYRFGPNPPSEVAPA
jgi:heme-degrading monooxygenase HmoA